jgi:hypothetical protein
MNDEIWEKPGDSRAKAQRRIIDGMDSMDKMDGI